MFSQIRVKANKCIGKVKTMKTYIVCWMKKQDGDDEVPKFTPLLVNLTNLDTLDLSVTSSDEIMYMCCQQDVSGDSLPTQASMELSASSNFGAMLKIVDQSNESMLSGSNQISFTDSIVESELQFYNDCVVHLGVGPR